MADESKAGKKEEDEPTVPEITVTSIEIEPNMCPVSDPLTLQIDFRSSERIVDAQWTVTYTVDSSRKRHIIQLGESKVVDYDDGLNSFVFKVDRINVSGIKPSRLTNVGLLSASMSSGSGDATQHVIDVNLVVQVSDDGGTYNRCIYNPLE